MRPGVSGHNNRWFKYTVDGDLVSGCGRALSSSTEVGDDAMRHAPSPDISNRIGACLDITVKTPVGNTLVVLLFIPSAK